MVRKCHTCADMPKIIFNELGHFNNQPKTIENKNSEKKWKIFKFTVCLKATPITMHFRPFLLLIVFCVCVLFSCASVLFVANNFSLD